MSDYKSFADQKEEQPENGASNLAADSKSAETTPTNSVTASPANAPEGFSGGGDLEDDNFPPRRGGFRNVFSAIKHVNEASATESVKQRVSDYITIGLVVVCILSLVLAVALPVHAGLKLLPLILTIGAVVFYIINRLGIIVSLNSRQALIVWQILIASFWLGVTSSMLVMMTVIFAFPH
jgi:hypothetical protein